MLLEDFIYILSRWYSICSHCPFNKTKKHIDIYIYIDTHTDHSPLKILKESKYNWNFMNVFLFNFYVRHF